MAKRTPTVEAPAPQVKTPEIKAGRNRNPRPPRSDYQQQLLEEIEEIEKARDAASKAHRAHRSIANRMELNACEYDLGLAWSAYCRAQNNHQLALRYNEGSAKYDARLTAIAELIATDEIDALKERAAREDALRKGGKE